VGGDSLVEYVWGWFLKSDGDLSVVLIALVPLFCEVVNVIDKAVAAPNWNGLTTLQISGSVVFDFTHVHVWIVGEDGLLSQLLTSEQHREGVVARVELVDFLDFDSVV